MLPPTDYESSRQISLMQAVITQYVAENTAVVNADDALEVATRLHNVGFVMAASTVEAEQDFRLERLEERVLSLESWAGIPLKP
jgi:hypothetical protein